MVSAPIAVLPVRVFAAGFVWMFAVVDWFADQSVLLVEHPGVYAQNVVLTARK